VSDETPGTGFQIASAYVSIKAKDDGLRESMASKIRAATEGQDAQVKLNLDGNDLRAKVKAEVEGANVGEKIKIPVEPDTDVFETEFRKAMAEAERVSSSAEQALTQAMGSEARSGRALAAVMDDVGRSASESGEKLRETSSASDSAGRSASNAAGGFSAGGAGMLSMRSAAASLIPVLAALPGLVGGGVLAVGTLGAAFSGVTGALKDHAATMTAVGTSGAQTAQTEFSNALAIRNATQAITDAKKAAATSQAASAQHIQEAEQALADTERQAQTAAQSSADAVVAAQQRVESATYSLAQAQQTETNALYAQQQAQQALTQAQDDAQNTINDLTNSADDAKLAVEGATNAQTAAQLALDAAMKTGTPAQQAAADFELRKAKQALVDAKQREVEATQKANQANKEGVDGLPAVVSAQHAVQTAAQGVAAAQHGVTQALQGQADAQHALVLAEQAQQNQAISTAESVARAQKNVADAVKNSADQQAASAESIRRAEQSLADTQKQQALAAAASAASGAAATDKFAADMKKNTPAFRDLVNQLLSMKTGFDQLKATAQTAMLPGFTQMLRDFVPLLPMFNTEISNMGKAIGGLAEQFGALFNDSSFRDSFQAVLQQGVVLVGQLGTGLVNMFRGLVQASGPAVPIIDALGKGLQSLLGSGIPAFFSGLSVNAKDASTGIGAVLNMVQDLLGPIGKLVGAFSGALGPALAALEPDLKLLADEILKALLPVMPQLSDALLAVVNVITQLTPIVLPLIDSLAHGLTDALKIATPLLNDMAGFLKDNAGWLKPVAEGILLVTAAVKAWNIAQGLGQSALGMFKTAAKEFTSEGKLATAATKGWKIATSELAQTLGTVVPVVGGIVGGALALGQWLGSVGDHARDAEAEVNRFTSSIIDLSHGVPNANASLDFLAKTAVIFNKSVGGGAAVLTDVDDSLARLVASGHADQAKIAMDSMTKSVLASGGSIDDLRKLLPKYSDALGAAANDTKQAANDAKNAQAPFQGLALRLVDTGQAGKNTADDLSHVDTALTNLDKQLSRQQALDDFTKSLNDLKDGAAGASRSIDGNSQSAMDNRKQLEDAVTAARHFYDAQIAAKVPVDQANAAFQAQVDALRTQAEKTYGSKKAVDDFLVSLGLIKPDYTTTLKVNDAEGRAVIDAFQKTLSGLSFLNIGLNPGNNVKARADGGRVDPGQTYVVGEHGIEIFRPDQAGTVYPHGQTPPPPPGGGGVAPQAAAPTKNITNNFNYYGTQHPSTETQAIMARQMATAVLQ